MKKGCRVVALGFSAVALMLTSCGESKEEKAAREADMEAFRAAKSIDTRTEMDKTFGVSNSNPLAGRSYTPNWREVRAAGEEKLKARDAEWEKKHGGKK